MTSAPSKYSPNLNEQQAAGRHSAAGPQSSNEVVPFEPPICAEGGVGGWLGSPNSLGSGSTAIVEPELEAPEEWVQESEEEDEEKYAEYSCYAFERHNVLRAFCIALVENLWSDRVSMTVIVLNCFTLALYDPRDPECEAVKCKVLAVLDLSFTLFFFVEMVIKMLAMGVWGREDSYTSDPWNKLDGTIAIVGVLDLLPFMDTSSVKAFRAVRPMRAVNHVPSLRVLMKLLFTTLPMLASVALLCFFIFFVFGLIGVQLWNGVLRQRCFDPSVGNGLIDFFDPDSTNSSGLDGTDWSPYLCTLVNENQNGLMNCPPGDDFSQYSSCNRAGPNPFWGAIHFDNIAGAWIVIFQCITLEGWVDIMYLVQDAYSFWVWIYFVVLVVVGSMFAINLALVVISAQFTSTKESELDSLVKEAQLEYDLSEEARLQNLGIRYRSFCVVLTTCQSRRYLDNRLHEIGQQLLALKAEGANLPEDDPRQVELLEQIMSLEEQCEEKEPEEPDIRSLEGCAKWRMLIKLFVNTNEFQMFIIGLIVVNVLLMATEHYNQPEIMTTVLANLNYVFCGMFFIEMVLKLIAFGVVGYVADGFNVFDGFIVIVSTIELFVGGGSGLVVLRTFRLVRVFKLARFLPTLQQQIAVMIATLSGVMSFLVLLFLYMFIFAVLGMFLFGNTFDFEPGVTERLNFDTFLWAITTVFVVLTQEDWNMVLYSGVRANGFITSVYFVVLLIMGNYVLLNLFVAILIEGFKEEEDPDAISEPNTPRAIDGALNTVDKWSQVTKSPLQSDSLPAERGSGLGFGKRDDIAASFGLGKSRRGSGVSRRRSSIVASEAAEAAAAAVAAASELAEEERTPSPGPQQAWGISEGSADASGGSASNSQSTAKGTGVGAPPTDDQSGSEMDSSRTELISPGDLDELLLSGDETSHELKQAATDASTMAADYRRRNETVAAEETQKIAESLDRASLVKRAQEIKSKADDTFSTQELGMLLEQGDETSAELQQAADDAVALATNHRKRGSTVAAIETDKIAASLSRAAAVKAILEKEQEAKSSPTLMSMNPMNDVVAADHDGGQLLESKLDVTADDESAAATKKTNPEEEAAAAEAQAAEAEAAAEEAEAEENNLSMWCFPRDSQPRAACIWLIKQPWFDHFIMTIILFNSCALAYERPDICEGSGERIALEICGHIFNVIFLAEMIIKVIALSFISAQQAYIKDPWNKLDCFIVTISVVDFVFSVIGVTGGGILGLLKIFRMLRALRPLRAVNKLPGLKKVVNTLIASIVPIGTTLIIVVAFFLLYGILGVRMFGGKLWHCRATDAFSDEQIGELVVTKDDCINGGGEWVNAQLHYDHLGQALMTLFVCSSIDGWVTLLQQGVDAVAIDRQPIENYNEAMIGFFVIFLLVGGFFILNMFVGIIVQNFEKQQEEAKKQKIKDEAAAAQYKLDHPGEVVPADGDSDIEEEIPFWEDYGPWRMSVYQMCVSTKFEAIIAAVIILNVLVMASEHYDPDYGPTPGMSPNFLLFLKITNYIFTIVFIFETCAKLIGFGLVRFMCSGQVSNSWNNFDLFVVLTSILGVVMDEMGGDVLPINPTLLRVLRIARVARILKLLKSAKGLMALLTTVQKSLAQVGNLALLLFLLFFIYAALGIELFGRLECSDAVPCEGFDADHANFKNFGMGMLVLFRITTGDNWNGMLRDAIRLDGTECAEDASDQCQIDCYSAMSTKIAPIYFVSFVLIAQFVMLNLVVGFLMQELDEATPPEENAKVSPEDGESNPPSPFSVDDVEMLPPQQKTEHSQLDGKNMIKESELIATDGMNWPRRMIPHHLPPMGPPPI